LREVGRTEGKRNMPTADELNRRSQINTPKLRPGPEADI
jgi:hypothetical protein